MKRILAISDIHGCNDQLNRLIEHIAYSPDEDQFIFLGDYCDRGPKSRDVIETVLQLVKEQGAIALRGNHDYLFLDFLKGAPDFDPWIFLRNGGLQTLESYYGLNWYDHESPRESLCRARKFILANYKHHFEFLKSLPYFYETYKHIFVHAGINPAYDNWRDQPKDDFIWIRGEFIQQPVQTEKTIVFGHTPTITVHGHAGIWFGEKKIGIDGACSFGNQLNCLEISGPGYNQYAVQLQETKKGDNNH